MQPLPDCANARYNQYQHVLRHENILCLDSEWCQSTWLVLRERSVQRLLCYDNLEAVYCLSTPDAAKWGQKLIRISRDFLELRQRGQRAVKNFARKAVWKALIETGHEEVVSNFGQQSWEKTGLGITITLLRCHAIIICSYCIISISRHCGVSVCSINKQEGVSCRL
jgi:hypothetical protein